MKKLKIGLLATLCIGMLTVSCEKEKVSEAEASNKTTKNQLLGGKGGSLAQFTILDDYLYTVDYKSLKVFHIVDPANPELLETINLGVGIETIFPQRNHLFIGTQNGVQIYNVTNPRSPQRVSEFTHVTSCDPVVANDDYAIATLRGGTPCNGNINQLNVIDITELENPTLLATEMLINPYGLSFSHQNSNLIYVCDGYAGLKTYDISDVFNIKLAANLESVEALDVIADENDHLIVLSRQGVYQYDASNPLDLVEKSVITVQ